MKVGHTRRNHVSIGLPVGEQTSLLEFFSHAQDTDELFYADQKQFGDEKDSSASNLPCIVAHRNFQYFVSRIMRSYHELRREERQVFYIRRDLLGQIPTDKS